MRERVLFSTLPVLSRVSPALTVFIFFAVTLSGITLAVYPGSSWVYLSFSAAFNSLLLVGFMKRRIFFETFMGIFFWLGFWFKFSVTLSFIDGWFVEPVGNFNFSPAAFDRALLLSTLAAVALLLASRLREKFLNYYDRPLVHDPLYEIYKRWRIRAWAGFAILAVIVAGTNAYFGIYRKGLIPETVLPLGLSNLYPLALIFGLSSVSAMLLNFELRRGGTCLPAFLLSLGECFLSNVSMLSRGMVLNGASLLLGSDAAAARRPVRPGLILRLGILALFAGMFFVSILTVNYMRATSFATDAVGASKELGATTPVHSFVSRWVGIEGVMSVSGSSELGWDLWQEAWREPFSNSGTSFYDKNLLKDSPYLRAGVENKHFVTLPGLTAFLYYPGSAAFLFAAMLALGLFGALVDYAVYRVSGGNLILCAVIGQVLAGRYAHFGYAPSHSHMLLGGILLVAGLVWAARNRAAAYEVSGPLREGSGK